MLMHLYRHPTHADVLPVLYHRVPKKLRSRLETCPVKYTAVGWGVHFVEGRNFFLLAIYCFLCFASILVPAASWAAIEGGSTSGFVIGSFLLGFVLFEAGLILQQIDEETRS